MCTLLVIRPVLLLLWYKKAGAFPHLRPVASPIHLGWPYTRHIAVTLNVRAQGCFLYRCCGRYLDSLHCFRRCIALDPLHFPAIDAADNIKSLAVRTTYDDRHTHLLTYDG